MKLSKSSRKESTIGQMVNLVSINSQSFIELPFQVNTFVTAVVLVTLSMILLYRRLGSASLAGAALMLALIPLTSLVARWSKRLQLKQCAHQDARIKAVNELLSGIKVVKLFAWELPLKEIIVKIRRAELRIFKLISFVTGFNGFVMNIAPFMVNIDPFLWISNC
jgi:ATP-binding cassette subfamily C (CFTR/MRP) protein 1